MVYEHELGVGDNTHETQLAEYFEVQPDSALSKKSLRFTEERNKIPDKNIVSKNPTVLQNKSKAEGWDSLNEAKDAIVAKKNTISQNNIVIPDFENLPNPNSEKVNFSIQTIKSKDPNTTNQDLRPAPISAKSFTVSRNSIELSSLENTFSNAEENLKSKELQESTANITYDHVRSVFREKRKEQTESFLPTQMPSLSTGTSKNQSKLNRLRFQMVCSALVLIYCISSLVVYKSNDPTNLTRKGDDLFVQSKFTESLQFYDQALKVDDRLIGPRLKRAQIYYSQGDYARALADCEHVLSLIPTDHQALKQGALLNLKCKKIKRAMKCAQELLRLQYTGAKDLVVITKVLAAHHEHLRAIYFYEKLLQTNKDQIHYEKLKDTIEYSRKQVSQYSYQKGLDELRSATLSDPSRKTDYLRCMVEFAAKRKNYSDAAKFCSEILTIDSTNAKSVLESAWFKYLLLSTREDLKNPIVVKNKQYSNAKLFTLKSKAYEAFQNCDYSLAYDALIQALQISPVDTDLKKFLSYTMMKANLLDRFTAELSSFDNLRSVNLDELIALMKSLYDSHQTKLASKVASYSISKYKKEAPAMLRIALECQKGGDSSSARMAALKGLNTYSKFPNQDSLYAGLQDVLKKSMSEITN